jgi:hypothetical protein
MYPKIPSLSVSSFRKLKKLSSPKKIQDFLDTIPLNWENEGETYMSVERTLEMGKAHCLEAALVAAVALWIHGAVPLIMDLKSSSGDDHIVALFKQGGRWGAISKTNHATLRFRDPVYKTIRELALSYFHEYIHVKTGQKILVSYSKPIDMRKIKAPGKAGKSPTASTADWISGKDELHWLAEAIDMSPHEQIYPKGNKRRLREADHMEMKAGNIIEWNETDKGV